MLECLLLLIIWTWGLTPYWVNIVCSVVVGLIVILKLIGCICKNC